MCFANKNRYNFASCFSSLLKMAESDASIDEALKQISNTLNSHSDSFQRIEQSLSLLRLTHENQLPLLQTTIRNQLQEIENNLRTLLISQNEILKELTNEIRSIKEDVTEIKNMVKTQQASHMYSTPTYQLNTQRADQTASIPNLRILQDRQLSTKILQETSRIANPLTIVIPSSSAIPTFPDTPSERSCLCPVRIEEFRRIMSE